MSPGRTASKASEALNVAGISRSFERIVGDEGATGVDGVY